MRCAVSSTVFLVAVVTGVFTSSVVADQPPHIVLIMADDLGWGDVGYHGSEIATPHIDCLAHSGVRLNQFYVQPVCSPTRGALLTGRYPIHLGLQVGVVRPWARHGLPLDELTLPQALQRAGYDTAICGKWHLGHVAPEYLPTRRGFDRQYGHYNGMLDYFTHVRDGGHDWHRDDQPNYDEGYATDLIAAEACRIIAEHHRSRPLFLYVPFNAPHTPLQAPQSHIEQYVHMNDPNRRTYAAMVTCMDCAVGRITQALEASRFPPEQTLIFFCSDNGGLPQLGSNGRLRAGKGTLYEGGIRVPAIAVWEGMIGPGTIVDEPLHIVDLFPTLTHLAAADISASKPLDGVDSRETILHGHPSLRDSMLLNVTPFQGALRAGHWKIVHNGQLKANSTGTPADNKWELFDLREDPWERFDLSRQYPDLFERLKQQLAAYAAAGVPPNITPNRPEIDFKAPRIWGHPD